MNSSGILVLSNTKNIKAAITFMKKYVNNIYIHLNIPSEVKVQVPQWSSVISKIYLDSSYHGPNMNIKILISPIKKQKLPCIADIKHIFYDGKFSDICDSLKTLYHIDKPEVIISNEISSNFEFENNTNDSNFKVHDVVVLGGTFDRIHLGHKIFLTEAVLKACKKIVVGVTDENMLKKKTLPELILPTQQRINDVKNFLSEIDCSLQYEVVPIQDLFGPTKSDPNMDMILVSEETYRGGLKVNQIRKENKLKELEICTIKLINDPEQHNQHKETKFSSSNTRMDLLGCLLKEPELRPNLAKKPYIIGLTGNIGSGKSKMAQRFSNMGAYIIDCDKVAHDIYEPQQPGYSKIIEHFGTNIIDENNKIDRKKLGSIVFNNPAKLETLNKLIWPIIMQEVKLRINQIKDVEIVVVEAAVLLKAGWDKECHEVWSMICPPEIAIKRVQERNNLSEEEAKKRIESQPSNIDIVNKSNVVFSSEWSYEFTDEQAQKAWAKLKDRIKNFEC